MTLPEGLIYVPGFLTEIEERDVLAVLAAFELHPYVLHDTPSRRLVRSFGLTLVAGAYDAGPAAPIPAGLEWLRTRCAWLMGCEPKEVADLLVSRYPPGAGIGWHRDAPQFGEPPADGRANAAVIRAVAGGSASRGPRWRSSRARPPATSWSRSRAHCLRRRSDRISAGLTTRWGGGVVSPPLSPRCHAAAAQCTQPRR